MTQITHMMRMLKVVFLVVFITLGLFYTVSYTRITPQVGKSSTQKVAQFINNIEWDTETHGFGELHEFYEKLIFHNDYVFHEEFSVQKNMLAPGNVARVEDLKYYDMDPRFYSSVLLELLNSHRDKEALLKVPFSWYDFIDTHDYNKILKLNDALAQEQLDSGWLAEKDIPLGCRFLLNPVFGKEELEYIETKTSTQLFHYDRQLYNVPVFLRKAKKHTSVLKPSDIKEHCVVHAETLNTPEFAKSMAFKPYIEITQMFDKVRPEVFALQARNYLINNEKVPLSLTILDSFHNAYQFEIDQENNNLGENNYAKNFVQSGTLARILQKTPEFSFNNIGSLFEKFTSMHAPLSTNKELHALKQSLQKDLLIHLNESMFEFDVHAKIEELELLEQKQGLNIHNSRYLESLKCSVEQHFSMVPKFFSEPYGILQFDGAGRHFDKRFFHGKKYYKEKFTIQNHLNHLVQVFLKFTKANGLLSWISHGNLYGYLYNGKNFYWDTDIDVQMSITHLHYLAQYFNQTLVLEDPREGSGRYLIEVGTNLLVRDYGNGRNNIDARFIDIDTGLYIDITGLSYSSSVLSRFYNEEYKEVYQHEGQNEEEGLLNPTGLDPHKIIHTDPNQPFMKYYDVSVRDYLYDLIEDPSVTVSHVLRNDLLKQQKTINNFLQRSNSLTKNLTVPERYSVNRNLNVVNCRNRHFVSLSQLSPLVNTMFHNVPAVVPHKIMTILHHEYRVPKSWTFDSFETYVFIPQIKDWISQSFVMEASNYITTKLHSIFSSPEENTFTEPTDTMSLAQTEHMVLNLCDSSEEEMNLYVSNLLNGFMQTTYRLKELEITRDNSLSLAQKLEYWKALLNDIGIPTLSKKNIFKDPYLFLLESRQLINTESQIRDNADLSRLTDLKKKVCYKNLKQLFTQMEQLEKGVLPLLVTEKHDFNKIGEKIFKIGDTVENNDNGLFTAEFWNIPADLRI